MTNDQIVRVFFRTVSLPAVKVRLCFQEPISKRMIKQFDFVCRVQGPVPRSPISLIPD